MQHNSMQYDTYEINMYGSIQIPIEALVKSLWDIELNSRREIPYLISKQQCIILFGKISRSLFRYKPFAFKEHTSFFLFFIFFFIFFFTNNTSNKGWGNKEKEIVTWQGIPEETVVLIEPGPLRYVKRSKTQRVYIDWWIT